MITLELLTKILCSNVTGAEIDSFSLDQSDDGSANRRRIFLAYNAAGQRAGLPATVFCKAAEALENRIVLGVSGTSQAETNFYNKVRGRLNLEAPRAYYANFDPVTYAYIVVMEDIAGRVQFPDERTHLTYER